jgi:hypothetical protein
MLCAITIDVYKMPAQLATASTCDVNQLPFVGNCRVAIYTHPGSNTGHDTATLQYSCVPVGCHLHRKVVEFAVPPSLETLARTRTFRYSQSGTPGPFVQRLTILCPR